MIAFRELQNQKPPAAQWVERELYKRVVVGSNPIGGQNYFPYNYVVSVLELCYF